MAPYQYCDLDESASEIRLMTLLPGRFEDDVLITMETVVLTKEHIPQYEALSYVWVKGQSRRRILEASSHGTISVTQNLATALPYLRREDRSQVFWIDAICVNQQNPAERGHQVKRMAAVYSMANRVIIWLGPETQNSTLALRAIGHLGSQLRIDWYIGRMTLASTGEEITQPTDPFDYKSWKSVGDLLRRPWFERLWIWQEIRLAKEALLFCGNEGLLWESFRNTIFYLYHAPKLGGFGHLIQHAYKISDYPVRRNRLESVLEEARSASCSDPRDKIYTLLSLADESDTRGLNADYSKQTEAVFQDLVLYYTSNLQSLDILSQCELRDDTGGMKLPSWVPNWIVPCLYRPIAHPLSCSTSRSRVQYHDGRVLAAMDVRVAVIECLETLPQPIGPDIDLHKDEVENAIRALIVPKIESLSLSERDATVISLCRTLSCDVFANGPSLSDLNFLNFRDSRKYMHRPIETTRDTALDDPQERNLSFLSVTAVIHGRSFFTTDDGYIGLAPIATKPGDQVCILLGCPTPLVLRPCENGDHKVVGACYIDGFMDGAACLGPLPSHWQPVLRYFEEYSRYYDAFLDHQSGQFQIEDPRLGVLPAGWYISDHEKKDAWNIYANDETGEKTKFDPRVTPEALVARGVEMREFQLV